MMYIIVAIVAVVALCVGVLWGQRRRNSKRSYGFRESGGGLGAISGAGGHDGGRGNGGRGMAVAVVAVAVVAAVEMVI